MNARTVLAILPSAALLAAIIAVATGGYGASAQSQATIGLLGVDAIIDGNTATKIGPRDPCVRTEVGSQVVVDLIVDEIPADRGLIGFQINALYNADLLEVVAANSDLMLGAKGQYQPFPGLSDPLPDTDGNYQIINADLASNNPPGANEETGKGVLSRTTFRAKAPGRSDVAVGYDGTNIYPSLQDLLNETIQVDSIAKTVVAIGEDCGAVPAAEQVTPLPSIIEIFGTPAATPAGGVGTPPTPTPDGQTPPTETPTPTPEGQTPPIESPTPSTATPTSLPPAGDGTDTGMAAAAVVLALIGAGMAGAGGFILYRRAQTQAAG